MNRNKASDTPTSHASSISKPLSGLPTAFASLCIGFGVGTGQLSSELAKPVLESGKNFPEALRPQSQRGSTLLELIVVCALFVIFTVTAAPNLRGLNNAVDNASQETLGFFKLVRVRAISTTRAYLVTAPSADRIVAGFANSCDEAISEGVELEDTLFLDLPAHTALTSTVWSVCFTARGTATSNIRFELVDLEGKTRELEIYLGGAVRVL